MTRSRMLLAAAAVVGVGLVLGSAVQAEKSPTTQPTRRSATTRPAMSGGATTRPARDAGAATKPARMGAPATQPVRRAG